MHKEALKRERVVTEKISLERCCGICLNAEGVDASPLGKVMEKVGVWVDAGCVGVQGSHLDILHAVPRSTISKTFQYMSYSYKSIIVFAYFCFVDDDVPRAPGDSTSVGYLWIRFVCSFTVLNV